MAQQPQRAMIPAAQVKQTSRLDAFFKMAGAAAKKGGLDTLVMIGKDPTTGEFKVVASPGAMEACKDVVAAKFGLVDPDTDISWPSM